LIPVSGDMNVNPGLWVRAILEKGSVTYGKYSFVAPETLSFEQILTIWGEVAGKETTLVEVSREEFLKLWGHFGDEMTDQLKFGETVTDWATGLPVLTAKDLGVDGEMVGLKGALEGLKQFLL
jgi:hypothetical protein